MFDSIILDAGPVLKNTPAVDTLLSKAKTLLTVPAVISEIRDQNARRRVETLLLPFLTVKKPQSKYLEFVIAFAKKSGDYSVLSRTDLEVLALTYEVECQRNGLSHLREFPGQKRSTTMPPVKAESEQLGPSGSKDSTVVVSDQPRPIWADDAPREAQNTRGDLQTTNDLDGPQLSTGLGDLRISETLKRGVEYDETKIQTTPEVIVPPNTDPDRSDSEGSEGWITPSNLKKHQAEDLNGSIRGKTDESPTSVACITTDFAMQNVLLQIGLSLLSPSLQRIRNIKTHIMRCHACFQHVKDTSKQFCPRCGNPTLTRVSCSTDKKGEFRIHLKKNMEWHHQGERYSLPKPMSGSSSGKASKMKGGGKGGWGQEIILSEDQKEYQRAVSGMGSVKTKDLMDEDYLPSILTGERERVGGRPKIGAGRNVNAKKRANK